MAIHSLAMGKLFHHEGGFVDDPDDRGGATNMGITQKTLHEWRSRAVTAADVQNLTTDEAASIYIVKYWNVMQLDEINSQELAEAVMDFGVNAGPKTAIPTLQRAANLVWKGTNKRQLLADGWIGPKTIKFVNSTEPSLLILRFFKERIQHYHDITRARRKNEKFLYAWIKRSLDHTGVS